MERMDDGIKLFVNGEEIFLPLVVINELYRQENIQWGKDILANYEDNFIGKPYDEITDDEFEAYAERLEENMLGNNDKLEVDTIKEIFS